MMKIRIVSSKTDQFRQGDELLVARTNTPTCPVTMLERFMCRTGMASNDERFLFRPIQKTKMGEKLRESGKISYTCLRGLFCKKLGELGFPVEVFGLHSLRAGGASAAANAKVPDRLFKRHGRWRSENTKDGYIKDDVESRLEVSRRLGLYLSNDLIPFFISPIMSLNSQPSVAQPSYGFRVCNRMFGVHACGSVYVLRV